MANELEKAKFALMAALQPDQFIDLAVSQGFTPQQMAKGIPNFTPKMGPAAKKAASAQSEQSQVPTGPSEALKLMMGLQGGMPGASPPPIPAPTGVATQPGAIGSLKPPPGAIPPGGTMPDFNTLLRMGAGMPAQPQVYSIPAAQPGAAPPPVAMPPVPLQAQSPISDPSMARAAALTIPPMGAPPLGALPPQATPQMTPPTPTRAPQAVPPLSQIATPPTSILSLLGLGGGGGGTPLPAPAGGIMDDPSVAAMSPDQSAVPSGLPAGGQDPMQAIAGLAGTIFPPLPGGLSNPGAAAAPAPPPMRVGLGLPPSMTPPVAGVVPPPPPSAPASPIGPRLKPVSSAPVETAATTKTPPATGSPEEKKSTYDALAAVGKAGLAAGRGSGRGSPGSAGVHGPNIQSGELLNLILKSLAPADYSPGYIPYGKLF